ncbi:MAG: LysR substrate-binding domain-containing protein, partial [Thiobacillus sp.]|nr:LysR substrate-binding domain-containing protein [Thiobacillus sp.]
AAALRLGRTQSAISLQIKRLEEAVGQSLLERSQGRVVGPTAEGRVLIDYSRRILRLNDEACACFARQNLVGRLRLGLPEELMESVFPRVLTEFTRDYPRVELSVRCDLSVRITALAEAGELDLAIAKGMPGESVVEGSTGWRLLNRDPMAWLAGEGSNAMDQRPLPLAVFHEGCVFRMAAITALAARGISWRLAFVGGSYTALRHAVAAGFAVTPLPRSLKAPGLVEVRVGLPELPASELIVRFGPGEVLPSARRLLDLFEAYLRGDVEHP